MEQAAFRKRLRAYQHAERTTQLERAGNGLELEIYWKTVGRIAALDDLDRWISDNPINTTVEPDE